MGAESEGIGSTPAKKRLGVVGTLVWDRIFARDRRLEPVEEWGGIAYTLEALSATLPVEWEVVPILKVGRDLSERAFHFLREIPRLDPEWAVRVVSQENNRVDLRYDDAHRRCEYLSGGVPPWLWVELSPLLEGLDAIYVNFISGFEMELDTAQALRATYPGPTYSDLHSLFLGIGSQGRRVPRELPSWSEWLHCFDAIQMNEDEFDLLGHAWGDPWQLAAHAVGSHLKLIAVTLGPRGAAYVASSAFSPDPTQWPGTRRRVGAPGPARSGQVSSSEGELSGDPTGCGDVWGATFFARMLGGDSLDTSLEAANVMAARNVSYRGARGLHRHLLGQIAVGPERTP